MADGVTFWLDNKQSSGTKAAQLGDQTLVNYREKFYVVVNDSAVMKGGKALRYSPTTLPATWKKVLRGDSSVGTTAEATAPAKPITRKKVATAPKEAGIPVVAEPAPVVAPPVPPAPAAGKQPTQKAAKAAKKVEGKPVAQSVVAADCPHCGQKHEIPVEKGRNGKPFFHVCTKCDSEFAVRFVQVTLFQAQVAGFL